MTEQTIGSTRTFVFAKGFTQVGPHAALIGEDDTRRLFAELYADPDRRIRRGRVSSHIIFHAASLNYKLLQLLFARTLSQDWNFKNKFKTGRFPIRKDWIYCIKGW